MTDWQPIETAPKDGTRVFLHRDDCPSYDTVGCFVDGKWDCKSWFIRKDMQIFMEPTHWKPWTHWNPYQTA